MDSSNLKKRLWSCLHLTVWAACLTLSLGLFCWTSLPFVPLFRCRGSSQLSAKIIAQWQPPAHARRGISKVFSYGLWNINRVCAHCIWQRPGDVRTIIYMYICTLRTFVSSMWGSLRLAPIMLCNVYECKMQSWQYSIATFTTGPTQINNCYWCIGWNLHWCRTDRTTRHTHHRRSCSHTQSVWKTPQTPRDPPSFWFCFWWTSSCKESASLPHLRRHDLKWGLICFLSNRSSSGCISLQMPIANAVV